MRLSYINQKEGEVRFYAACHFNHCHPYRDGNRRIPLATLARFGYTGHCLSDLFIPVFQGVEIQRHQGQNPEIYTRLQWVKSAHRRVEKLSLVVNRTDYGQVEYHDQRKWRVKQDVLKSQKYAPYVYDCSRTVCDNARKQPFKYVCKYFGIKTARQKARSETRLWTSWFQHALISRNMFLSMSVLAETLGQNTMSLWILTTWTGLFFSFLRRSSLEVAPQDNALWWPANCDSGSKSETISPAKSVACL